jgi:hypothetical protein
MFKGDRRSSDDSDDIWEDYLCCVTTIGCGAKALHWKIASKTWLLQVR